MYHKILVPMALNHGLSADTLAIAEALRAAGGTIIALHVYELPQGSVSAYLDADVVKAGYEDARAQLTTKTKDIPHVTPELIKGHTSRAIIDFANEHEIDLIVIGSHNPGLGRFLLGSTAARVVRHANCAVHVCRQPD